MADEVGNRTQFPRVTVLILFGFAIGHSAFNILPEQFRAWYEFLATVALTVVAFLLGGKLSWRTLHAHSKEILAVSVAVVAASVLVVTAGLMLIDTSFALASRTPH